MKELYYYLYCDEGKVPIPTLCVVKNIEYELDYE